MAALYRFVVDVNVGRLAKWLRVMGYDALFPRGSDDKDLVRITMTENRLLVTWDAGFTRRRAARQGQMRVMLIKDDDLQSHLRQLMRDMVLNWEDGFSRCVRCHQLLDSVAKEDVASCLPHYVFQNHQNFMECPQYRRLYWRGTHWSGMVSRLLQAVEEVEG